MDPHRVLQLLIALVDRLRLPLLQQRRHLAIFRPFEHRPESQAVTVTRGELDAGKGRAVRTGLVVQPRGDRLGELARLGQPDGAGIDVG